MTISGGVGYAYSQHIHEGDRVQHAADRLTLPAAWTYLGETKEPGSPFLCVVSCPQPVVTKMYRVAVSPSDACSEIKARVAAQFGTPRRETWDAGCGWRAPLHSVGGRADVGAYAVPSQAGPPHTTDVSIYFSGGPT
jgi:hypothetical protein